jgi:hypothetical protein
MNRQLTGNQRNKGASAASTLTAIERGYDFLYHTSQLDEAIGYRTLLTCCFAVAAATSHSSRRKQLATRRANTLIKHWRRENGVIPANPRKAALLDFVWVGYALKRLGKSTRSFPRQIAAAIRKFSPVELLGYDPRSEPPPENYSFVCDCGLQNLPGRKTCKQCRCKLTFQTRYRTWFQGLTITYILQECGVGWSVGYEDVLKWLPALRPYPAPPTDENEDDDEWRSALYAVTHLVYSLNDFGTYRLSPRFLKAEIDFIKKSIAVVCSEGEIELLGELLDTLKAFGLRPAHPLIRRGTNHLLENVNADGSWGDPDEDSINTLCHTTWTAVDGLRTYSWRRERAGNSRLRKLLK